MADQSLQLKILSYNIHKGFSGGIAKYTLEKIRREIRILHPDLIFLQEVQGQHEGHKKRIPSWSDVPQFEYLAEDLWPHHTYGKNAVYSQGHHGNAILSKFPILSWENLDISQNRFETRGFLHAVIELPGSSVPLHALCTHLGLFESDRKKQLKQLTNRIESVVPKGDLLIACGDFNDWRENASQSLVHDLGFQEAFLSLHGRHAKTFPSWLPVMRLDRIYFRGFTPVSAICMNHSPWDSLSDHVALSADLLLR
ncbi:MAG: endonuclease/exonuclease/phosphatase family protein [Bdellovibrionia bacterium]